MQVNLNRYWPVLIAVGALTLTGPAVAQVRSAPVTVYNDATNPVPGKQAYARRPFAQTVQTTWAYPAVTFVNFSPPADGLLVIENISLNVGLLGANKLLFLQLMVNDGVNPQVVHFLPVRQDLGRLPVGSAALYLQMYPLRLYVPRGSTVALGLGSDGNNSGGLLIDATLAGYVVPPGSPDLSP
jgi:hypothetical protein